MFSDLLQTAAQVSNALEAGMVNSDPFGSALAKNGLRGVKDSGVGTETFDAFDAFDASMRQWILGDQAHHADLTGGLNGRGSGATWHPSPGGAVALRCLYSAMAERNEVRSAATGAGRCRAARSPPRAGRCKETSSPSLT